MKIHFLQTGLRYLWIAGLVLVLDQVTKYLAVSYLTFGEPLAVMPHFNLTLVYNYGAAFSFLADMGGWQRWFFVVLALVVGVVLLVWLSKLKAKPTLEVIGLQLILAGAIGNLIDRLLFGKVTDFLDFYYGSWHYATFNIADMGITLGAVMLVYYEFFLRPKASTESKK
ncbi:signal peptidase II [Thiomicrospira sp. R3]|uniref:signal peptidase II n=1 Tax=Thiomicrospira sp. R3 TaxID=3035472 RepID=UPI00259BDB87|nr:signal peptidase II [Thiomicrospira sp. R3]WFE68222.1 signal peptidase II [Thiomicrospira sp. R3]